MLLSDCSETLQPIFMHGGRVYHIVRNALTMKHVAYNNQEAYMTALRWCTIGHHGKAVNKFQLKTNYQQRVMTDTSQQHARDHI